MENFFHFFYMGTNCTGWLLTIFVKVLLWVVFAQLPGSYSQCKKIPNWNPPPPPKYGFPEKYFPKYNWQIQVCQEDTTFTY